jgi:hypothetical protein
MEKINNSQISIERQITRRKKIYKTKDSTCCLKALKTTKLKSENEKTSGEYHLKPKNASIFFFLFFLFFENLINHWK